MCVYTYLFFIHSSVSGHLGCFHVLAIINSATMSIGVRVSLLIIVLSGYMGIQGFVLSFEKVVEVSDHDFLNHYNWAQTHLF